MSTQWDPDLYLRFGRERTQPSIDLVSRIELDMPRAILDVGCGPGNSTSILANRWTESELTGVDSSAQMTEKARRDYPHMKWIHADVRDFPSEPVYDLVYSNAVLQWIPDHESLIPHLFGMVRRPGALAVQIPLAEVMPVRQNIRTVAGRPRWRPLMSGISRLVVETPGYYYDLLAAASVQVVIWQTAYFHEMKSHSAIITMLESTALRPYLERIENPSDRENFLTELTDEVKEAYTAQQNGHVLFPFHRLFFVAYK